MIKKLKSHNIKYVYLIQSLETSHYKIGVSIHPEKRLLELNTGNSSKLKLVEKYKSEYANIIEKTLHNRYGYLRKEGEWFEMSISNEVSFINECKNIEKNIVI